MQVLTALPPRLFSLLSMPRILALEKFEKCLLVVFGDSNAKQTRTWLCSSENKLSGGPLKARVRCRLCRKIFADLGQAGKWTAGCNACDSWDWDTNDISYQLTLTPAERQRISPAAGAATGRVFPPPAVIRAAVFASRAVPAEVTLMVTISSVRRRERRERREVSSPPH